jgi:hypothetical protein
MTAIGDNPLGDVRSRHRLLPATGARCRSAPRSTMLAFAALSALLPLPSRAVEHAPVVRAAVPPGAIQHVLVINLENQDYAVTFGPQSPARYLNGTLLPQGQLIVNYFATSHASLGNYTSEVSGQQGTPALNNDCLDMTTLLHPPLIGQFTDVAPGTDAADRVRYPGQVVGDGCVFPAPTAVARGARTIGDQLDEIDGNPRRLQWRMYAEDMGNDPARDYGTPDPQGGTDCAHPPIDGVDHSNDATTTDQYATRHNPFVYFHSIIDNAARCNRHVVPLGRLFVGTGGQPDRFQGHLYQDLRRLETTPKYLFVTPNLCNDGHDATCAAPNVEGVRVADGSNAGGLVAADLWLKHWMPMILASPAYRSGTMLIVLTFDESGGRDSRACEKADQADCHSPTGPNLLNPGYRSVLAAAGAWTGPNAPFVYPGGGQVGAVVFNKRYIRAGTVNTTGSYNHYSALRSVEDLLGITTGGDDGLGHLGFAAVPELKPFGRDVFNGR